MWRRMARASGLRCDGEFRFESFGVSFDMAIAHSLFTHLPLNHIEICLNRLAAAVRPGGILYATILPCDESQDWYAAIVQRRNTSYPDRDPYHYRYDHIAGCVANLPWDFRPLGEWKHPGGQVMLAFSRR